MRSYHKSSTDDELKKYLAESAVDSDLLIKEKTGIDGALGWWKVYIYDLLDVRRVQVTKDKPFIYFTDT